jgi:predicted enzyme related to lactoylglutathione lyase
VPVNARQPGCRFLTASLVVWMQLHNHSEEHRTMGNKIIHVEVVGKDGAKLQKFYSDVFGWSLDTNNPGGYGMLRQDELTAGFGAASDGGAGHVTFYVNAEDPQGTLAKVEAAGGRVIMPLTEVAPETNIALFADPEGHVVGLM